MKIEHFAGYDLQTYADAIGADLDALRCQYIAKHECEPTDGELYGMLDALAVQSKIPGFCAVLIRPSGVCSTIWLPDDIRPQLQALYAIIGCDNIEIVPLDPRHCMAIDQNGCVIDNRKRSGRQHCLVVDDCGAINDSQYNRLASTIYDGFIFGNAVYCALCEAPDGDGLILTAPDHLTE